MAGLMTKSALKLARPSLKIAQSSLPAYAHKFVSPESKVKRLRATRNTSFFRFWYCVNFLKPTCFPVDKKSWRPMLSLEAFLKPVLY